MTHGEIVERDFENLRMAVARARASALQGNAILLAENLHSVAYNLASITESFGGLNLDSYPELRVLREMMRGGA